LTEKAIASRLISFLDAFGLMLQLQQAYCGHYGTETALLKVLSGLYGEQVTLLGLLHIMGALNCVKL